MILYQVFVCIVFLAIMCSNTMAFRSNNHHRHHNSHGHHKQKLHHKKSHLHHHHFHSHNFFYRGLWHRLFLSSSSSSTLAKRHRMAPSIASPNSFQKFRSYPMYLAESKRSDNDIMGKSVDNAAFSMDGFTTCRILDSRSEADGLRLVTIEVPSIVYSSYHQPGQYVKLRPKRLSPDDPEPKASFFAIASPPHAFSSSSSTPSSSSPSSVASFLPNQFTFLIKETPNNGFVSRIGSEVEISTAMGKGFGVTEAFDHYQSDFPVNQVILVATGSGLAPIAAMIESSEGLLRLQKASPKSLMARKATLLLGVRSPDHLPLQAWIERWVRDYGIRVIPVFSQPASTSLASSHANIGEFSLTNELTLPAYRGYVQDLLQIASGLPSPASVMASWTDAGPIGGKTNNEVTSNFVAKDERLRFMTTYSTGRQEEESAHGNENQKERPFKELFQVPRNTAVLLCGQKDMTTTVRDLCMQMGIFEGRILMNF